MAENENKQLDSLSEEKTELRLLQKKANILLSKREVSVTSVNTVFFNRSEIDTWTKDVVKVMTKINPDSDYLSDFCKKQSNLIGHEVAYTQFEELRDIVRSFVENPEL